MIVPHKVIGDVIGFDRFLCFGFAKEALGIIVEAADDKKGEDNEESAYGKRVASSLLFSAKKLCESERGKYREGEDSITADAVGGDIEEKPLGAKRHNEK